MEECDGAGEAVDANLVQRACEEKGEDANIATRESTGTFTAVLCQQ
jgi:hypothetical protein